MPLIRDASEADAAELVEIYRPFVEQSTTSFETVCPSIREFAARITKTQEARVWLVAEDAGRCVGYAYATRFRERAAYDLTVETSAYVDAAHQGRGIGRQLYQVLLDRLVAAGFCTAVAGITLPNNASIALHMATGFLPVGVFHRVGRKFGGWHDVAWFERVLRDQPLEAAGEAVGEAAGNAAPVEWS
jgi:L-amino acid N-acyltransferase YncA